MQSGIFSTVAIVHNEANYCVSEQDIDIGPNPSDDAVTSSARESNHIPPISTSATANAKPISVPILDPLSEYYLSAIGLPNKKEEVLGSKLPEEISKRWAGILVDGLTKEGKQELRGKMHTAENIGIIKAPLPNPEIFVILGDNVRMDTGIAGLTKLTSTPLVGNMDGIDVVKRWSIIKNNIFRDLHFEHRKTRRKLGMSSLVKKFSSIISNTKTEAFLFGEKMKCIKTEEQSGLKCTGSSTSNIRRFSSSRAKGQVRVLAGTATATAFTHQQVPCRSEGEREFAQTPREVTLTLGILFFFTYKSALGLILGEPSRYYI